MKVAIFSRQRAQEELPYFARQYAELFISCGHDVRYVEFYQDLKGQIIFENDINGIDVILYLSSYVTLKKVITEYFKSRKDNQEVVIITNQNLMLFGPDSVTLNEEIDLDNKLSEISKELEIMDIRKFSLHRAFHNITPEIIKYRNKLRSNMGIIYLIKTIKYTDLGGLDEKFFNSLNKENFRGVHSYSSDKINTLIPWIIQQSIVANKFKNEK